MRTKEFTLGELKGMEQSLSKLLTKDVDVRLAWRLRKFAGTVSHALTGLETCRIDTAKQYADPEDPSRVAADKVDVFKAEYQQCLEKSITIEIPDLMLSDITGLKLSAMDMEALEFLFPTEEA